MPLTVNAWMPAPMANEPVVASGLTPSMLTPVMSRLCAPTDGRILEPMHYACGDGDGLMPMFDGWFVSAGKDPYSGESMGYYGVDPVEWQPLRAVGSSVDE